MARAAILLGALLLLTGCDDNGTGPIYPVARFLYDWVQSPGALDPASDRAPVMADPVVHFRLSPGERRSALMTGDDWRLGHIYLMGFDVRLDPRQGVPQPVTLSRLLRRGSPPAEIAAVHLGPQGITVMGRTCIPASELDNWHRVELRVRFEDDDRGFLEVFCDRRPIWARTGIRTTQATLCRRSAGCSAPLRAPARFRWQMGLMSDRHVRQPVGLQMKRIHFRRLMVVPHRVGNL